MSDYLCKVLVDLRSAPKNTRYYIVLDWCKHLDDGIIVLEQKHVGFKILPSKMKHFSEILSKAKMSYLDLNKLLLYTARKKTIFVFNKCKVSILEEKIFTNLEKSIEKEFNLCVELEYDVIQRRLKERESSRVTQNQGITKIQRKNVSSYVLPRPPKSSSSESFSVINLMTNQEEYTNGTCSLQYCVANVVQPDGRRPTSVHVHSDGGSSRGSTVSQSISNSRPNSIGNCQSENSFEGSPQVDSANSRYSAQINVLSNGGPSIQVVSAMNQNSSNVTIQVTSTGNARNSFVSDQREVSDTESVQQPRHPLFREYSSRRASFCTWMQFVLFDTEVLARAGFYYTGEGTVVRCFSCGTELVNLSPNDDPMLKHVQQSPYCGYLRSKLGPIGIADYQARIRQGNRVSWQANDRAHMSGAAEDAFSVTSRNPGPWSASDHIRSPQYQAYSIRLASFARWPNDIRQKPEQVADAGFYYTGLQDVVRCFACDGGLKNWDPEDDPWIEHARWFPQCPFVKRVKGEEFIDLVRRMTEDSDEEEDAVVHSTFQPNNPMADSLSLKNELNPQLDQENAENVLETDAAKCALDAGYSRDIVARAINELLIKGKLDYTSKDIMELILEKMDKGELAHGDMNPSPTPGPSTQKNDSKRSLIEENKILRQSMLCVECRVAKKDILLLPCTHLCLCSNCSAKTYICPLCYKKIREKIKTYVI